MKRRLYLDTNVFADAFQFPESPQARILGAASLGHFEVTASDVLLDELRGLMRKLQGRSAGFRAVRFVAELPERRVIHEDEWRPALDIVGRFVRDLSDSPHLAAAFVGRADAFVTRNRRSVREGIFDHVALAPPEIVAGALEGKRAWPEREELRSEWKRWSLGSPRG